MSNPYKPYGERQLLRLINRARNGREKERWLLYSYRESKAILYKNMGGRVNVDDWELVYSRHGYWYPGQ